MAPPARVSRLPRPEQPVGEARQQWHDDAEAEQVDEDRDEDDD